MAAARSREPATLDLGAKLRLPLDAVTQRLAILANSGAGKSNAAVCFAEELYTHGLPFVVIDPKGDWWGIRSSADGQHAGLSIPVFGGLHGDLPLEPDSGKLLASVIVEENLTCVLDVSELHPRTAYAQFLTGFAEALYRLHGRAPQPRQVILEEADEIIPETPRGNGMADCLEAWSRVATKGRNRGLGVTLVSQRSAKVNKTPLEQVQTLIALRTTGTRDRKAILDWIDHHGLARELADSLPYLKNGEAWMCSPEWLGLVERVQFRRRRTFDSGATPSAGERPRGVATSADVDLSALGERIAALSARANAQDPERLAARLAEAEAHLATARREIAALRDAPPPQAMLHPDLARLRAEAASLAERLCASTKTLTETADLVATQLAELAAVDPPIQTDAAGASMPRRTALRTGAGSRSQAAPVPRPAASQPRRASHEHAAPTASDGPATNGVPDRPLSKCERSVLSALAQMGRPLSRVQVALLAGYAHNGGGFNNGLGSLRKDGLITRGDPIQITDAGLHVIDGEWDPLPRGPELLAYWQREVGKAERAILDALADHPGGLEKEDLAALAGYEPNGGGFNNAIGKLRRLELITPRNVTPLRLADTLASELHGM